MVLLFSWKFQPQKTPFMNMSKFGCWFIIYLVFFARIGFGFALDNDILLVRKDYITWEDIKVDDYMLDLRDEIGNRSRVLVVDKNGGGDSVTVQGAVDMVPENNAHRVKIFIRPGVYSEKVFIPASKPYISLIGDYNRASETVITWHDKAADPNKNGGLIGTFDSGSVSVESDYFCAAGISFQNTVFAVPGVEGQQAVAFRISGDKAMFYKVRFLGSQDTLLDETGSHYFYRCLIQGTTDFIFGYARSLYHECNIHVVGNGFAIAAHHRNSADENTGFSFLNCIINGTGNVYLGRAWGDYSRIIYSYCRFDIPVRPEGWDDWRIQSRDNTVLFGEFQCSGRGANRTGRAPWSRSLKYLEAIPFMTKHFIHGEQWLRV